MYVELSARRTGKTHRLAEAIVKWLDEDTSHIAIVPMHKYHAWENIKQCIPFNDLIRLNDRITTEMMRDGELNFIGIDPGNVAMFYDEFDLFPEEKIIIGDNNYYVATIRHSLDLDRIHDLDYDPIAMQLIRANDYYFESYTCFENIQYESASSMPPATFELELCGRIFEQEDVSEILGCFYTDIRPH